MVEDGELGGSRGLRPAESSPALNAQVPVAVVQALSWMTQHERRGLSPTEAYDAVHLSLRRSTVSHAAAAVATCGHSQSLREGLIRCGHPVWFPQWYFVDRPSRCDNCPENADFSTVSSGERLGLGTCQR